MRFLLLAVVLVGCGTSSTTGPDGSVPNDSGVPDTWHGCTKSIDPTGCGSSTPPCLQTFDGGCTGNDVTVSTCGNYIVWTSSGTDTAISYYYDASTGQLVAAVNAVIPSGDYCVGGPSNFVPPTNCTSTRCGDGG